MRKFRKQAGGNTIIEFAFIAPVFLAFLFGVIEMGMVMWGRMSLNYAVSMATRYTLVYQSTTSSSAVIAYAKSLVPTAQNSFAYTFLVSITPGSTATIQGSFTYNWLVLPLTNITMTENVVQPLP